MEFVQPIREKKQIDAMKRQLRGNATGLRDLCLFVLGINSGLRVSDLLKLTVGDVVDEVGEPRDRIALREQKTGNASSRTMKAPASRRGTDYC
jgi:integrase